MERLTLPQPANSLWKLTAQELHQLLDYLPGGRPVYRMGGGTILAAAWNHRKSTDIDLTVPKGSNLAEARRLHGHEIRERMEAIGAGLVILTNDHFMFEFKKGKIEITEADPRPGIGTKRVECNGFPIDQLSPTQILRGKLERSRKHEPPARDLLDVIVTRRVDPAALESAVNMLDHEQHRLIKGRWKEATYRVNKEAPETLQDVKEEYKRFTRDLCKHAIEDFEDSVYITAGMERDGDSISITTRTLRQERTRKTTPAELQDVLEGSGLNKYLTNYGPGETEVRDRIQTVLTNDNVKYMALTAPSPSARTTG